MRKAITLLAMCGFGLAITVSAVMLFSALPSFSEGEASAQNTALENGGFEGEYTAWDGEPERMIAPSWSLWYTTAWPEGSIAPPKAEASNERHGGEKAQHVFAASSKNFDACLYQQISGITVGHYIRFAAWAKVEASSSLNSPDKWQTRIGIDPDGGTNPLDINYYTHLSLWDTYTNKGEWQHLAVVMKATSPTATAYACAHPIWPLRFSVYWDDAAFAVTPESLVHLPTLFREYCTLPPGELYNPDLEEDFCALHGYQVFSGYTNILVAPYWTPYWNDDYIPDTSENKQPEYGPTDRSYRVRSGQVAQQFGLSGGGAFEAGIYQVVTGTTVSDTLRFTIWGLGWNQHWPANDPDGTNELVSDYVVTDGLRFRVGIDPYGGKVYTSPTIVWSEFYDPYDAWHQFEVTATAAATRVSVWAYAHPAAYWLRWNETFWDGASLEVVEPTADFSSETYNVAEGAGLAEIAVTLDVPRGLPVSIDYATSDGTAQAPGDYAAVSGTLIFPPGETSRVFGVPIYDDTQAEGEETVIVTLSDASNAAIGGTNPATLIILDDDRAPACDASNNYCEDYDEYLDAYGPLGPNVPYQAYPEDPSDYYHFVLDATRVVTVEVQNYQATGDLILYNDVPEAIANWGMGGSTMEIGPLPLQAGTYYVQISTEEDYNTDTLYTLFVTY